MLLLGVNCADIADMTRMETATKRWGVQFPMQLDPSRRAHLHESLKTAQFILGTHTCIIFKV